MTAAALTRILAVLRRIFAPGRRPEPTRQCPTLASFGLQLCMPEPEPYVRITLAELRKARP